MKYLISDGEQQLSCGNSEVGSLPAFMEKVHSRQIAVNAHLEEKEDF